MTENDAGRRPPGPPPSSVTRGVELVRPAVEAPSVEASGQIVYADSPPVSGNGIASVVFGALALVLALLMMSNEWGRLFVPTAALVGLSLLFAASSIARVKKGTERGRYGQAAVSLVLIAVAVWFFRIDVTPWIDLIVTKVTEPTPVWPSSSGS